MDKVLEVLSHGNIWTTNDIAELVDMHRNTVNEKLAVLVNTGKVTKVYLTTTSFGYVIA